MIYNLNSVTIEGRLTQDPSYKALEKDGGVCNLDVAHNHRYPGKETKENGETKFEEKTSFLKISAFNGTGKKAAESLKKGDQVIVEGRLEERRWKDEEGNPRSITGIVADRVHLVSHAKPKEAVAVAAATN